MAFRDEKVCFICTSPIESGAIEALGNFYHPQHWNCMNCHKPLGNSFHAAPDGIQGMCDHCFNTADVKGLVRCTSCRKFIQGNITRAKGGYFHAECFTCGNCKTHLGTNFVERDNNVFCVPCAESMGPPSNPTTNAPIQPNSDYRPSDLVTCSVCNRAIDKSKETCFTSDTKRFHENCLKCDHCGKIIKRDNSGSSISYFETSTGVMCQVCSIKNKLNSQIKPADSGKKDSSGKLQVVKLTHR